VGIRLEISDTLKRLGRHYIAGRYPDAHASGSPGGHYGEADARQAIQDSGEISRFIDDAWSGLRG
jgi:HEPN domain-containing protein